MTKRKAFEENYTKVGFGDYILYEMCEQNNITQLDPDKVGGKMWLIGRSYSASIERSQGKKISKTEITEKSPSNTDSDFFQIFSEIFVRHDKTPILDDKITSLRARSYKYDSSNEDMDLLTETVNLLQILNEIIKDSLNIYNSNKYIDSKTNEIYKLENKERKAKNNISFASKYLHFHLKNIVYIMDKYSLKNGKSKKKGLNCKDFLSRFNNNCTDNVYREYIKHCFRCYTIATERKDKNKAHTPRNIDNFLMLREKNDC